MVLLCYPCHRDIHMHEIEASRSGWISWVDPYVTPLKHARFGWVLLVPDGSLEPLCEFEACLLLDYVNGTATHASAS